MESGAAGILPASHWHPPSQDPGGPPYRDCPSIWQVSLGFLGIRARCTWWQKSAIHGTGAVSVRAYDFVSKSWAVKCTRSKSPQNNHGQASSSNFGSLTSGPLKGLNILGVVGDQQVNKSCLLMWRLPLAYIYPRQHYWARAVLAVVRLRTRMAQVQKQNRSSSNKMCA